MIVFQKELHLGGSAGRLTEGGGLPCNLHYSSYDGSTFLKKGTRKIVVGILELDCYLPLLTGKRIDVRHFSLPNS